MIWEILFYTPFFDELVYYQCYSLEELTVSLDMMEMSDRKVYRVLCISSDGKVKNVKR